LSDVTFAQPLICGLKSRNNILCSKLLLIIALRYATCYIHTSYSPLGHDVSTYLEVHRYVHTYVGTLLDIVQFCAWIGKQHTLENCSVRYYGMQAFPTKRPFKLHQPSTTH